MRRSLNKREGRERETVRTEENKKRDRWDIERTEERREGERKIETHRDGERGRERRGDREGEHGETERGKRRMRLRHDDRLTERHYVL